MRTERYARRTLIVAALGWAGFASAQTFVSGSTGADGAYAPSCAPTPCTVTENLVPGGVYNYTTVTIPAGVTVRWNRNTGNSPVTLLATGDVTINGALNLNGNNVNLAIGNSSSPNPGALGGPGGFNGGNGQNFGGPAGTAGQGPGGGTTPGNNTHATYGAPATSVSLIPLFGGSGSAGGTTNSANTTAPSGGGGGGAILVASSSKIVIAGSILTNGGGSGVSPLNGVGGVSCVGGGSGGAIRLVAPQITGGGSLQATGGPVVFCGGIPSPGKIRLEAFTLGFTGAATPPASQSAAPGPTAASGVPALVALPTIAITTTAGVQSPPAPNGSYAAADVSLPTGTANPVPVVIGLTNTPIGSAITLRVLPVSGPASVISAPTATGTFTSSTSTVNATLTVGTVTVLQASATMTLTGQVARLFPSIDGEPVERVMVASGAGLSLVTKSGKEIQFEQLAREDQLKVALAWQALRETR